MRAFSGSRDISVARCAVLVFHLQVAALSLETRSDLTCLSPVASQHPPPVSQAQALREEPLHCAVRVQKTAA